MLEFPVVLGDIGGTNARFAVLPGPSSQAIPLPRRLTAADPTPVAAIRTALEGWTGPWPRSALLAVAAPVDGPVVRLTNAPWTIGAAEIGTDLALARVALVNDYVPMAASLVALREDRGDLMRLGPEVPARDGPKLVLGPGTGFGASALLPFDGRFAIQSTEAAHVDFGPSDAAEAALWRHIDNGGERITSETLLSGPGLLRLYRACAELRGHPALCATPEEVTDAGIGGTEELAVETLRLFARLLGRFAGDLALIFGATGGVFVGSGIAPTISAILERDFRARFEDKAPYRDLMGRIATFVILHPEPALKGLAGIAAHPARFIYDSQSWAR